MTYSQASALASLLPPHRPLLGIDLGEKTIGLALSDILRTIATPLKTLPRGKFSHDAELLRAICAENAVAALVLGYPVNMDGSPGPRAQATRAFGVNIEKTLSLPVLFWDERMSTQAVTRTMLEADLSRARRAELVDKLAAAYLLQGALDALSLM